jgi:hypothetical protein
MTPTPGNTELAQGRLSLLGVLVAAVAGATVPTGAVVGAYRKAASPLDTIPWALLTWIALGVLRSYVAPRRPPGGSRPGEGPPKPLRRGTTGPYATRDSAPPPRR